MGGLDGPAPAPGGAGAGRPRWRVDAERVSLGFFSFTRYLMCLDLVADRRPAVRAVVDRPVVGSAFTEGFAADADVFDPGVRLDDQAAFHAVSHVLEAGGSPTQAMVQVFASTALVIQG